MYHILQVELHLATFYSRKESAQLLGLLSNATSVRCRSGAKSATGAVKMQQDSSAYIQSEVPKPIELTAGISQMLWSSRHFIFIIPRLVSNKSVSKKLTS